MKERPIIFNDEMVRAILDGRKTQTRLIAPISSLNLKSHDSGITTWSVRFSRAVKNVLQSISGAEISEDSARRLIANQFCLTGQVGDRLWVRECFATQSVSGYSVVRGVEVEQDADYCVYRADNAKADKWTPSIHMPRLASRITLEITGVRVERLQDISEADAKAEGIAFHSEEYGYCGYGPFAGIGPAHYTAQQSFASLWQSIYGNESWVANPWVWVVEFKRI